MGLTSVAGHAASRTCRRSSIRGGAASPAALCCSLLPRPRGRHEPAGPNGPRLPHRRRPPVLQVGGGHRLPPGRPPALLLRREPARAQPNDDGCARWVGAGVVERGGLPGGRLHGVGPGRGRAQQPSGWRLEVSACRRPRRRHTAPSSPRAPPCPRPCPAPAPPSCPPVPQQTRCRTAALPTRSSSGARRTSASTPAPRW